MAKRKRDPRLDEAGLSPEVRACIDSLVDLFPTTPYPERITRKGGEVWDEGQIVNAALVNRSWLEVTGDEWDDVLSDAKDCFMDVDAIAYFLPGMLRMALIGDEMGWISGVVAMRDEERRRTLLGHFNPAQLACIAEARRLIRLAEDRLGQPDEE